jgi:hypothetical protein
VVGGPSYDGSAYPADYPGTIFFGAFGGGFVQRLVVNGQGQVAAVNDFATGIPGLVDLELAPHSRDLVYVDLANYKRGTGSINEVAYTPVEPGPTASPTGGGLAASPPLGPATGSVSSRSLAGAIIRVGRRLSRRSGHVLSGTVSDPGGVRELEVGLRLGHQEQAQCRWLVEHRRRPHLVAHPCAAPLWTRATLAHAGARSTRWRLVLRGRFPSAAYELYFRAVDQAGTVSYPRPEGASPLMVRMRSQWG